MFPRRPGARREACQFALHSRHLGLSIPSQVWLQIVNATIDRSLGEGRARRYPSLDPQGAQVLRDYYGQSADAFTTRGDQRAGARVRGGRGRRPACPPGGRDFTLRCLPRTAPRLERIKRRAGRMGLPMPIRSHEESPSSTLAR